MGPLFCVPSMFDSPRVKVPLTTIGGESPPRPSLALRSGFGNRHVEPIALASRRWSRRLRLTCVVGLGTSATVKRLRCCAALETWLRRRLRSVVWKQWKRGRTRYRKLRQRGVGKDLAAQTAGSPHDPWRIANSPALSIALPNAYFVVLGLPPMVVRS